MGQRPRGGRSGLGRPVRHGRVHGQLNDKYETEQNDETSFLSELITIKLVTFDLRNLIAVNV